MYKEFESLDDLYNEIEIDKNWTGAESSLATAIQYVLYYSSNLVILKSLYEHAKTITYMCKV